MEAQLRPPAASPALAPAAASGAVPDGRSVPQGMDAECATSLLNANAIVVLALLVCGFVAALALHVALRCALRATRGACYYGGSADDDDDVAPHRHQEYYRRDARRHGGGGGRKQRAAALVQTLPSVAYTAGLELAGSSRSECAICLAEFARGDPVRVLPRCTHGFHARCIDRWLAARPTCPVCRQPPFAEPTALLLPGTGRARPGQPAAVQLVRVVIVSDSASRRVEP